MEHRLMWAAFGASVFGWLCSFALGSTKVAKSQREPFALAPTRAFWWLALALPLLVWLATLPTSAPFSQGQGFGRGFLMGGLASLASAFVVVRAHAGSLLARRLAALSPLFGGVAVASVPLIWMRPSVVDALAGVALGWMGVALILVAAHSRAGSLVDEAAALGALVLSGGAAFVATLCGAAILGVYRDFAFIEVARGTYPAVALTVAASGVWALLAAALVGEFAAQSPSQNAAFGRVAALACLAFPVGIGVLLGLKVLDDIALIVVLGSGALLGIVLWAIARDDARRAQSGVPVAAIGVALCGFMWALGQMQGFGVALLLLGAWPMLVLALPIDARSDSEPHAARSSTTLRLQSAQSLLMSFCFVAILLVSRVFATRFRDDLRGATLSDTFALFGFVAGFALPALIGSWGGLQRASSTNDRSTTASSTNDRSVTASSTNDLSVTASSTNDLSVTASSTTASSTGDSQAPFQLIGAGALALIALGAMISIWGLKVAPAFFAGVSLSVLALPAAPHIASTRALFALALAWTLAQWAHHFAPLALWSRAERLQWVLGTTVALIFLVLLLDYGARLWNRLRARPNASMGEIS